MRTLKIHRDDKVTRLAQVPLFAELGHADLERIAQLSTRADVDAGTVLIHQGSNGNEFFVLIEGTAEVTVDGSAVGELQPGDFFGELALLDNGPRNATVTTTSDAVLLVLSGAEFRAVLQDEPQVAANLLPTVSERLRHR